MAAKNGMYTTEKMDRQLRKGNVAEALFRLWSEDHAAEMPGVEIGQFGYNPSTDVVAVADKREKLLTESDPDFAAIDRVSGKLLCGISSNGQKSGYRCTSTMGGMCIPCSRAMSCYEGHEENLWYNRYNIDHDYPQFQARHDNVDVVLVSLMIKGIDSIFKWVQDKGHDSLLLRYIRSGCHGIDRVPGSEDLLHYLKFGARRNAKSPRAVTILWLRLSEIISGKMLVHVTGGLSQYGRPREVYCVGIREAHSEEELVPFLASLVHA